MASRDEVDFVEISGVCLKGGQKMKWGERGDERGGRRDWGGGGGKRTIEEG